MFVPDPENRQLVFENKEQVASFERLMWYLWPP